MGSGDRRTRHGAAVRGHGTDLRRRILDAARKVFVLEGHEATSMRVIAREVGYSTTTIYQHFANKEELLRAVCHRDFRALSAAFFLHVAVTRDPIERLRRMGRSYLDFALRHPRQYAFLFMNVGHAPGAARDSEGDPVDEAYVFLFTTVAEAAAHGRLRACYDDPERVTRLFWGSLHGLAALHVAGTPPGWVDPGELVSLSEATIEVVFRGLLR